MSTTPARPPSVPTTASVSLGAALAAIALVVAACGGAPPPEVASAPPVGGPTPAAGDSSAPSTTSPVRDAGGPNRAVVEIGRQRYVADLSDGLSICRDNSGAILGSGAIDGFVDGHLTIRLPPPGWEDDEGRWDPPSVTLDFGLGADGSPIGLHAGGDDVATLDVLNGFSQVDSYVVEGDRASGSATFVDLGQYEQAVDGTLVEPAAVDGTFAIECG